MRFRQLAALRDLATVWSSAEKQLRQMEQLPSASAKIGNAAGCHAGLTPPDLPCRHPARQFSAPDPAMAAAEPSLHPMARASRRPALHRLSGSPASPWDGSAPPRGWGGGGG